ncbi:GCNA [Branchiostoma lanceolatum]|uniref:GCNA protein n=1 Tax=Branchiostoma lanceolatum TaxID=7740 RepID=A0A8K0A697_BRALA|nr:GCNA [Branchiostoma lanceolatum]
MAGVADRPRGDDDDNMSSLLARVSKKLGWDKFGSLEDALQEVEAKTPDWKGGKKRNFFDSRDDKKSRLSNKENTSNNIPADRVRSYSDGCILQQGSSKKDTSKTIPSTNDYHADKTGLPKVKDSNESPYFSTSGAKTVSKREISLSDKPSLSNCPFNSLSQKKHSVRNTVSSSSDSEGPVPAVKPKLTGVRKRSSAEKGRSQGCSSSDKCGGSRKMGSLDLPRPDNSNVCTSEEDSAAGSSKDPSRASPVLVSSDSDDFESFVQKMKSPTSSRPSQPSAAHASLDDFIVDSEDDSDGEDDVFGPVTPRSSNPVYVVASSSDEDEFQKGIIARYRSPKPSSGLRRPKKAGSSRKGSHRLLSSSSSDEDQPRILSWRGNTPLGKNNTPLRKNNTSLRKNNTPFRNDNTPLRKQVLQKSFLTPQAPPGYSKPSLSVPKVPTAANPRAKSTSAAEPSLTAAPRRNSEPTSFLSSLSTPARGKAPASPFVSEFKKNREELVKKLFKLYNETVFDNKLSADMSVTWNNKMRKTAGFCYTGRSKLNRAALVARIELSEKVCDSAERVRDTLIHEMCHAATWVLNGVKDGHGRYWQFWARKANQSHPSLPVITRCHTYAINTKFTYQCTECGYKLGRHSKSLDVERQVCGYCRGRFQLVNKDGTPAKTRAPSKFALFVKERYGSLKKENTGVPHREVMRLLSSEFASKTRISSS